MGDYMSDYYGGGLGPTNVNPSANGPAVGYDAKGITIDWWYGANVERCPAEDPYVLDETFGPDPGSGIMANIFETGPMGPQNMGNDTVNKFGAE